MPTYQFECPGEGNWVDVVASIHDEVPQPNCQWCGAKMIRVYSVPGVKFNADGFYSTGG